MASRKTNKQLNDRTRADQRVREAAKQQLALKRNAKKRLQQGEPT